MKTKRITYVGVLTSMALVLSYLERMIPPPVPVPGIKLGLANIIILMALYLVTTKDAFLIAVIKSVTIGILFTGPSGMIYGLTGSLLSFGAMIFLKSFKNFSVIGVSIIGGVFHNVGQILIATLVINNEKLLYYLPYLIIFGVISGLLTGIVAYYTLINLKTIKFL